MMPARYRGRTDIWINGTYWAGSIIGTFVSFVLLNAFAPNLGWRLSFLVGPALAVVIIFVRRNLPESPRWLLTHGREEEALASMKQIEDVALKDGQHLAEVLDSDAIVLKPEKEYGYWTLLRLLFRSYPKRATLGASLMITQSFLYNAIFFTYALVLTKFYHVPQRHGAAVRAGVRGRQPGRPAMPGPPVRQRGPQEDDLRHLHLVRGPAGVQRLAVRRG